LEDYLSGLNPNQKEAVLQTEGPVMVIAGAGSGKTRVLTYRIAHLVSKGVDPFSILALTFTNKAAKEMKERIAKVIGTSNAKALWMGTFHSVFAKILRVESAAIGYPSNFTIYDSDDVKKIITRIVKDMQLDKDYYKPRVITSRISSLKNNLITYKSYKQRSELQEEDIMRKIPHFAQIYEKYCQECFKHGAMDFDDLLLKTNELFFRNPKILAKYQSKFRYIMVDEYQDTNHSQYLIVKALAAKFENICVVGDDAQSIYAFRGANIYNILNFSKDYPSLKKIKLEQNYRSTQSIVNAANSVIKKNKDQLEKKVWTENETGDLIDVYKTETDNHEAFLIANLIWEKQQQLNLPYQDFCIMYRTNAQSRVLEESLRKKNMPYKIYGGLSFYQRKEIKDFMAYLRLVINPHDDEAVRRVINFPARGIGQTSQDKLNVVANSIGKPWLETIDELYRVESGLGKAAIGKLQQFSLMVKNMQIEAESKGAYEAAKYIVNRSGLMADLKKDMIPENISKLENLEEMLNAIQEFVDNEENEEKTLPAFLEDVALLTDTDRSNDDPNHISLMTIHQSKGLEFPYVYIVGMEEDLFPSMNVTHSREGLEEERRLFYVAITRAEKKATLSYALSRYRFGRITYGDPSRFLDDIDEEFLDFKFAAIRAPKKSRETEREQPRKKKEAPKFAQKLTRSNLKPLKQNRETTAPTTGLITDFTEGMQVNHHRFGNGEVINVEPNGANTKITIRFTSGEVKTLIAKFAKLTKL
jgi:DNA helicase-2/ATP-dependent DNA helicase PcrA